MRPGDGTRTTPRTAGRRPFPAASSSSNSSSLPGCCGSGADAAGLPVSAFGRFRPMPIPPIERTGCHHTVCSIDEGAVVERPGVRYGVLEMMLVRGTAPSPPEPVRLREATAASSGDVRPPRPLIRASSKPGTGSRRPHGHRVRRAGQRWDAPLSASRCAAGEASEPGRGHRGGRPAPQPAMIFATWALWAARWAASSSSTFNPCSSSVLFAPAPRSQATTGSSSFSRTNRQ